MKTLLITLEYPPFKGGVGNVYANLKKHWPTDELLVLDNNQQELINPRLPALKWLPAVFGLWKTIKQERVEHVIVGHLLPLGTAAYLAKKFLPIRYSVVLHGMDFTFSLKSFRKKALARKILNQAERVICSNSYVAELAKAIIADHEKIKVVTPGIDPERPEMNGKLINELKDKYNLHDKIVLLTVGRLVKRKGVDKVIENLPTILKSEPNLKYVIVGRGEEIDNYRKSVTELNLAENVIIIADANDEERNAWYDLCDIFIMPSRNIDGDFEGFGIVYIEANLAGKPVIAGNSGGIKDAVIDNLNGLLVNPEKDNEIVEAVLSLAKDKDLRSKLGQQGKERALKSFNWQTKGQEFYNALNK